MTKKTPSTRKKPPESDQVLFSCVCSILLIYLIQWYSATDNAQLFLDQNIAQAGSNPSILDGLRYVVHIVLG